ncbi:MAG: peptidoglycan-binding protein [Syntrophomonadaceae bacterium]|nr:peptidoglycan-binding protein [Syntrophomonadaceae bacterium]MDD3022452.1 peptidoglycan-binding protein [Syntrophomonadaceae bacterium]
MVYASRYLRFESNVMTGPDVLMVQGQLIKLGYALKAADGIYGNETSNAVKELQKNHLLNPDGIVDPYTWNILQTNTATLLNTEITKPRNMPSISIDVVKRKLTFFSRASVRKVYPVAVGKKQTPTPLGNWVIVQKAMNPGGPFGARWMRLSVPWGGYGIHGTNNPSSIGKAASHGCIRMYNKDVIEIYSQTPLGTPVSIIGKTSIGRLLKLGSTGADVKELQTNLKSLGFFKFKIDGIFAQKTHQAVIEFQKSRNIMADGIVGPQTFNELQKALDIKNNAKQP